MLNHMNNSQNTGPKDVFGYILAIGGLYTSVLSFGSLLFSIINLYVPDALAYQYGGSAAESLKWPLAVLVVVFPLYVLLTIYLVRDLEKNPEKKELRTRKWLLHFTLFASAIVIIGDLITLIFQFLNGDLTVQFILKVFAVLLIAGAVFTYYIWSIRKDIPASKHPTMKWFVRGTLALGVFFILWGFFIAGSPFAERAKRFDERRVQHLQTLQSEIINFWQAKEKLPVSLDELRDDIRGFAPPKDPETDAPYRYTVEDNNKFILCATFKTSATENTDIVSKRIAVTPDGYPYYGETWLHGAEEKCFVRTIDPDLYPPYKR